MKLFQLWSAPGQAALSIWRLHATPQQVQAALGLAQLPACDCMRLQWLHDGAGVRFDQGLVGMFADRGGEVAELHLHGGHGVAAALRKTLTGKGWSEQAPTLAADEQALLDARSPAQARAAAQRLRYAGAYSDPDPDHARLRASRGWLEILGRRPRILIAGPPNAGKSTLFNAWLQQQRVTVSADPGTTRDSVEAPVRLGRGDWALDAVLVDSAGLWASGEALDRAAMATVELQRQQAWRVVWVFDAAQPPDPVARTALAAAGDHDLRLLNRTDLGQAWSPEEELGGSWRPCSLLQQPHTAAALEKELLEGLGPPPPTDLWLPLHEEERRAFGLLAGRG